MATTMNKVLGDVFGPQEGAAREIKEAALVIAGVAALAIAAKIKVPMWPVPITMGTFAVLTIGAAYGPARGMITMGLYMLIGALGYDVFANTSAELNGWDYMKGVSGGYLVGFVMATLTLGYFARRGWDRSMLWMALAMLIGNVLIYVPGLAWLGHLYGWDMSILENGLKPYIFGDALKLVLAALIVPSVWKFVRK